jgi:hypothetical protein
MPTKKPGQKRNILVVGSEYGYRLKDTIPCESGSVAFLAETMVPCGSVFVNQENQIGGNYYLVQD